MEDLRCIMKSMVGIGISDLAVVELDRSEGGVQFLDCSLHPEEPVWWKLNDMLRLHGWPESYPRDKKAFEDGCQIRYDLEPFGSSTTPPVRVRMFGKRSCPLILMRVARHFFHNRRTECGSILELSMQGFPDPEDVAWRLGDLFAAGPSIPGTFGFGLFPRGHDMPEEWEANAAAAKKHRIAEYDSKGVRFCWAELADRVRKCQAPHP
jgi:hypothetical protein